MTVFIAADSAEQIADSIADAVLAHIEQAEHAVTRAGLAEAVRAKIVGMGRPTPGEGSAECWMGGGGGWLHPPPTRTPNPKISASRPVDPAPDRLPWALGGAQEPADDVAPTWDHAAIYGVGSAEKPSRGDDATRYTAGLDLARTDSDRTGCGWVRVLADGRREYVPGDGSNPGKLIDAVVRQQPLPSGWQAGRAMQRWGGDGYEVALTHESGDAVNMRVRDRAIRTLGVVFAAQEALVDAVRRCEMMGMSRGA